MKIPNYFEKFENPFKIYNEEIKNTRIIDFPSI